MGRLISFASFLLLLVLLILNFSALILFRQFSVTTGRIVLKFGDRLIWIEVVQGFWIQNHGLDSPPGACHKFCWDKFSVTTQIFMKFRGMIDTVWSFCKRFQRVLHPFYFIKGLKSQKPYIVLFLELRLIQWHKLGVPRGHALTPYISETIQFPTPKPYVLFFMIRCIQWNRQAVPWGYASPPPVKIRLNNLETIQNPTSIIIYIVPYDKIQSLTLTVGPQRVCPTPSQKLLRSMPSIKCLKMLSSSDGELKLSPHGSLFE